MSQSISRPKWQCIGKTWALPVSAALSITTFQYSNVAGNLAHASYQNRFENRRETHKNFRLIPELSFLSTTDNYDAQGAKAPVTDLLKYNRIQLDVHGIYGFTPRLAGYFRLSWLRNQVDHNEFAGDAYGLGEQAIGLNYRVWESASSRSAGGEYKRRMSLDLQAQLDVPLYSVTEARANSAPIIGDQVMDFTMGAFLTVPLNQGQGTRWFAVGGAGYMFRSAGFSAGIPWNLTVAMSPEKAGFFARGSLLGQQSLVTEETTQVTIDAAVSDAGGSFIVDALSSSYTSGRLIAGYQHDQKVSYYLSGMKTLTGKSAPDATTFLVGIQYRFGAATRPSPAKLSPAGYGKSNQGFVNYNLDGKILRANDRLNLIKIDKGSKDGVQSGQIFDIFSVSKTGAPSQGVARATVTNVQAGESALVVKEYYREVWIEEGFVAKRLIQ